MTIVGLLTTNQQGHLKKYGNIWYQPKAISNILSMSNLKKKNSNMKNFIASMKKTIKSKLRESWGH